MSDDWPTEWAAVPETSGPSLRLDTRPEALHTFGDLPGGQAAEAEREALTRRGPAGTSSSQSPSPILHVVHDERVARSALPPRLVLRA
jgi:hypothetical protein